MQKSLVRHLTRFQRTGVLPPKLEHIQTNVIENVTEDGLTNQIKNALRNIEEQKFSTPILIGEDLHLFYVKKKALADSSEYLRQKKFVERELFEESSRKITNEWLEREMAQHYSKKYNKC